ncbi:MAG: NAD(P)-dependent oxidoreductase [Thermoanaerobaculia bacterium]|nr:NAD(P)-dependent oxidoreductase [Thermoanaerobaculia bacterium]
MPRLRRGGPSRPGAGARGAPPRRRRARPGAGGGGHRAARRAPRLGAGVPSGGDRQRRRADPGRRLRGGCGAGDGGQRRSGGHVAAAAATVGARLVQVSTDYVFDGTARSPYAEEAPTGPRTAYGASKLAGERQALALPGALVVRTSWLFGAGGPNFVDTMLTLAARGERRIAVVDDQAGAPTYAPHLAAAILDLLERGAEGIVHYRDREPVTWAGFARAVFEEWLPEVEIVPVTTAEVPRPAPRPAYSVLDVAKVERILGRKVAPWRLGLVEHLSHTRPIRRH